jgi:hypothetical protein
MPDRFQSSPPLSDINVTPFVDVMLVLLVIFMVTAPMFSQGLPVNLPQAAAPALVERQTPGGLHQPGAGLYTWGIGSGPGGPEGGPGRRSPGARRRRRCC